MIFFDDYHFFIIYSFAYNAIGIGMVVTDNGVEVRPASYCPTGGYTVFLLTCAGAGAGAGAT